MGVEVVKGNAKRVWLDGAVKASAPTRSVTAFAQAWRNDPDHPLFQIVAGYERAMSLSPYSSYDPDAADEIEEINLLMDGHHDDLSALLADQAAYLSDRDKH